MWLDDCDDLLVVLHVQGPAMILSALAAATCGVAIVVTWMLGGAQILS